MKFLIFLIFFNIVFIENFVNSGVVNRNNLFKLDIVHYNDFHVRFEETSVTLPVCQTNDYACLGGFARLCYQIQALLKEKPGALLLNAGDTFQGTYWFTLLKGSIVQKFINMLPHDAHAIGNHEFDTGVKGLEAYLKGLKAPVVAANLDVTKEPSLKGLFKPHVILERNGRKIGIIGLITPATKESSNTGNVIFKDCIKTAEAEAKLLTEKGVDIIIVLSHCGLKVDTKMAEEVGENIDIIVGGHSHSLLWNQETSPTNEAIFGPYPTQVEPKAKPGHKVLIVTASSFTKYLGNLTVYFDQRGNLMDFEGEPIFLNRSIPEDPIIKAQLEPYRAQLHALMDEVIGFANNDLPATPCGQGECAIGNTIADTFLKASQEKINTKLPGIAFLVRNQMKGDVSKGEIDRGVITNMMPYNNSVETFVLPGKYIKQAFELCLKNPWTTDPFSGPLVPSVAGIKLVLNTTSEEATVLVKDGDEFKPLEPEKDYQITTGSFNARGGNGFWMFPEHGRDFVLLGMDAELLEKYIKNNSPIDSTLDNRLKLVS